MSDKNAYPDAAFRPFDIKDIDDRVESIFKKEPPLRTGGPLHELKEEVAVTEDSAHPVGSTRTGGLTAHGEKPFDNIHDEAFDANDDEALDTSIVKTLNTNDDEKWEPNISSSVSETDDQTASSENHRHSTSSSKSDRMVDSQDSSTSQLGLDKICESVYVENGYVLECNVRFTSSDRLQ